MYNLFTRFRPAGGPSERVEILRQLTDTKAGNSAAEILTWARQWRRSLLALMNYRCTAAGSSRDVQHHPEGE